MGGIVSGVSNLLGNSPNGSGFQAQQANLIQPVTADQAATSYNQTQSGLTQQQNLINALSAQNGIGNQGQVYNQLQGVVNGTGPNPAQAQLNQATGQNVANQAALMAGQRGAGANVGLLARQAAQQGAGIQQNAVGQAATLQANQSLNALNQAGGIAGQQVGEQQSAVQGYNQDAQGQQGQILGALQGYNQNQIQNTSQANSANAGIAQANAGNTAKAIGGLTNAAGVATGLLTGGAAPAVAAAANLSSNTPGGQAADYNALPNAGYARGGEIAAPNPKVAAVAQNDRFKGVLPPHVQHIADIYHPQKFAKGGAVKAMVSPGEMYLPPDKAKDVAVKGKNPLKEGKMVPGKAQVKGDSKKNDTVPADLEEGGVMIPRSVMQSKNPTEKIKKFVEDHINEHGSGDHEEDFKSALKRAMSNRKVK